MSKYGNAGSKWLCGIKRHILCTAFLTLCFEVAFAKIPEPDTILVGNVSGAEGVVLSRPDQTIVVRAVVDGVTLATAALPSDGDGRFVLRVPMDDGAAPRLAGTAKSSDLIRIVVDNQAAGISTEVEETKHGGVEIPAGRGNILALSFSVTEEIVSDDLNGNGIPDSWEMLYSSARNGHAGISLSGDDSGLDNDGDGFTNKEEWMLGTDPLDESSRLAIWSIEPKPDSLQIRFAPLVGGRAYSLQRSTTLLATSSDWKTVATFIADEDMESFLWVLPVPSGSSNFYRVSVEVSK